MKKYLLRIDKENERSWLLFRKVALELGISAKHAIFRAIESFIKKKRIK